MVSVPLKARKSKTRGLTSSPGAREARQGCEPPRRGLPAGRVSLTPEEPLSQEAEHFGGFCTLGAAPGKGGTVEFSPQPRVQDGTLAA